MLDPAILCGSKLISQVSEHPVIAYSFDLSPPANLALLE
jgi:hypothetical protein